jgi:hypothetical protein
MAKQTKNIEEVVSEKLDKLAAIRSIATDTQKEMETLIERAFSLLPDLDMERQNLLACQKACQDDEGALIGEIKEAVLEHGSTIKGEDLMAVWSKGRTSWDTKKLDGFAAAHPEILQFKSSGKPSISIKENKS